MHTAECMRPCLRVFVCVHTGRGIGACAAELLARNGASVIVNDVRI